MTSKLFGRKKQQKSKANTRKPTARPIPKEAIVFNGKMADGRAAPNLKTWLDERRKLGLPTGGMIHVRGLDPRVMTVKGGRVRVD